MIAFMGRGDGGDLHSNLCAERSKTLGEPRIVPDGVLEERVCAELAALRREWKCARVGQGTVSPVLLLVLQLLPPLRRPELQMTVP